MKFSTLLLIFSYAFSFSQNNSTIESNKINEYIEAVKNEYNLPGVIVAISDENGIKYLESFGNVSTDDNFLLGSLSKSFTALLILKLQEQGLLKIDDPVVKHLDWFQYNNKEISDEVKIKNLLNHTSGLTTEMGRAFLKNNSKNNRENLAQDIREIELESAPNNKFEYSNTNYRLLGYIIEDKTNESYGNVLKDKILKPFFMTGTTGFVTDNIVQGFQYFLYSPIVPIEPDYHKDDIPVGYIKSTATDMSKYLTRLMNSYNGLDNTVIDKKTIHMLFEPNLLNTANYAFGWEVADYDENILFSHTGSTQGFRTYMVIAPGIKKNIIVLTNIYGVNANKIGKGIIKILLNENPDKISKKMFLIIRSLPILVLLLTLVFAFTLRKWLKRKKPILLNKKIIPNIMLILGLVMGVVWIIIIPGLNGATLKTVIEFDKSSGYSLILLTILTIVVTLLGYFISARKTLPNNVS